jgi:hypothetical protein
MFLGHQGARENLKTWPQRNLFYQQDIRLKNPQKCRENEIKH